MKRGSQCGFTLVEMLLAIALFAMLSLTALAVFRGVLKSDEITRRKSTQLTQLQRALAIVERDFTHAQARAPIGDKLLPAVPEFAVRQTVGEDADIQLLLIRNGWPNPHARLPRATLERVVYRYRQGRLERLSYPSLDSPQAAARSVLLLTEVTRFRLRFYLQGEWLTTWRAGGLLPQAVEIVVETPALGEVRRIVTVPAARPS
ncbi:type II secretion system minor pseudopilin GspJ [Serratia marcescens]|uniref:type II secretion system minor pseudopilin GspJ n=1 Tax=Serratia marcescens TaxID=615 RepID=UPI0027691360|nr:type II secretion system minor pseudopilin GspJ [Serratia marcescens]MDP8598887.1 type II secretion system minor pseudopilin GspJ [Serratia marcescens]MDP8683585.1 type II secretion system minor pseudopilin GspJ [Serratia marcescens]MDP8733053.1 type II secretion system minor pseudopilin GspJ [Serratia marcescens]MDP8792482.1 type II secretion system minor pseudopilin GspJ [Serratia marcescens]HEJ7832840.1 type II secretion system minor pseudopilin GspJ [Serratia marcescens]